MYEEKKYEIKEPKESLHWISFNSKKSTKLLEEALVILKDIKEALRARGSTGSKHGDEIPF